MITAELSRLAAARPSTEADLGAGVLPAGQVSTNQAGMHAALSQFALRPNLGLDWNGGTAVTSLVQQGCQAAGAVHCLRHHPPASAVPAAASAAAALRLCCQPGGGLQPLYLPPWNPLPRFEFLLLTCLLPFQLSSQLC